MDTEYVDMVHDLADLEVRARRRGSGAQERHGGVTARRYTI